MTISARIKFFRINLEKHPVKNEEYTTRLYYFTILYSSIRKDNLLNDETIDLLATYKKSFNIKENDFENIKNFKFEDNKINLNIMIKLLRKTYFTLTKWNIYKKNFKYLLISEILYLENFITFKDFIDKSFINKLAKYLKIRKKDLNLIITFLQDLSKNKFENAKKLSNKSKFELLNYFYEKYKNDYEFEQKKEKNIVVMATMSSGKSTILNAILGQDILPYKNEACTAKTISIVQNNNLDRCIGFAKGNETAFSSYLNNDILDNWNSSSQYNEINLESNLSNIYVDNKKLRFIDTPGTNNSLDSNHAKITKEILKSTNIDLIIYVLNATNLACDDDFALLCKVKEYLKDNSKQSIVFVLNKVDQIDVGEKESLDSIYKNTIKYLKNVGFENPKIISISAYATRLFRKAIQQKEQFTRRERLDFWDLYEKFASDEYNLNNYTNVKANLEKVSTDCLNNILKINKDEIQLKTILDVLKNTGFLQLESYLILN